MSFCEKIRQVIESLFNRSGLTANIEIKESNIILGLYGGGVTSFLIP
jgi:hypothetical protein